SVKFLSCDHSPRLPFPLRPDLLSYASPSASSELSHSVGGLLIFVSVVVASAEIPHQDYSATNKSPRVSAIRIEELQRIRRPGTWS
ncbi:hypothetical protein ACMD2_03930, partial [Ananas comosus]